MSWTNKSFALCREALWYVHSLQCWLSFQVLLVQILKASQRREMRAFSGLSWVRTQPCEASYMHIPRNTLKLFKARHGHLIPQISLSSFLAILLCDPAGISASGSCGGKQLLLICFFFFTNALVLRLSSLSKLWVRSNKDKPCKWTFPGNCWTGHVATVCWGRGFLGSCKPVLLLPVAARLLVFSVPVVLSLLVSRHQGIMELGRMRWEQGNLKHRKTYCSYWDSAIFLE